MFALLESVRNLLQNPYDIAHLTLGILLQYLGKLKIQIFYRYSADMEENASILHYNCLYLCYSSTNLVFSVLKNGVSFPILIAKKIFFMSLFFCLFTFAINLWHQKFVTSNVTAMFVNNQHGIQRWEQDFNKKFVFEGVHSKEVDRRISREKLDKARC